MDLATRRISSTQNFSLKQKYGNNFRFPELSVYHKMVKIVPAQLEMKYALWNERIDGTLRQQRERVPPTRKILNVESLSLANLDRTLNHLILVISIHAHVLSIVICDCWGWSPWIRNRKIYNSGYWMERSTPMPLVDWLTDRSVCDVGSRSIIVHLSKKSWRSIHGYQL